MSSPSATFAARDRRRHELAELVRGGAGQAEVLGHVVDVLATDVGFEAVFVAATDPATTLFAGAGIVAGLPGTMCAPWFDNEFATDDFLKFIDLHHSGSSATTLHRRTHGRPGRSARHRDILAPCGLGPELRVTLDVGGECWGALALMRTASADDFDDVDLGTVDTLADVAARGLRAAVLGEAVRTAGTPGPEVSDTGVIVLGPHGDVRSMNETAVSLMEQLGQPPMACGARLLPGEVRAVATRAQSRAMDMGGPEAMLRLRGDGGVWLTVRAECTRDVGGEVDSTVVLIQPSPTSAVLPLLVSALELTEREEAVLAELVRGVTTDEAARALQISPHTVRDHVKSLFAKVGVRSRGELVSRLYGLHLAPGLVVEESA